MIKINNDDIVVTGIGMVSCIGFDADTSCASARAGINRTSGNMEVSVFDEESGELIPVIVNSINIIADGFEGIGRLALLGKIALLDLVSNSLLNKEEFNNIPALINISDNYYWREYYKNDLKDVDTSPFSAEEIVNNLGNEREEEYRQNFISKLSRLSGVRLNNEISKINFAEQSGVVFILNEAIQYMRSSKASKCLIGGVDSLVNENILEVMNKTGLLKTSISATGMLAGEAASFILIEKYALAIQRKAKIFGIIGKVSTEEDKLHRLGNEQPNGLALASTIINATEECKKDNQYPRLMISSLNGDVWKSAELGNALIHLPEQLRQINQWFPIISFGEVGAATAAVFLCLGVKAFQRKYAGTDKILITVSGDDGKKGSVLLYSINHMEE